MSESSSISRILRCITTYLGVHDLLLVSSYNQTNRIEWVQVLSASQELCLFASRVTFFQFLIYFWNIIWWHFVVEQLFLVKVPSYILHKLKCLADHRTLENKNHVSKSQGHLRLLWKALQYHWPPLPACQGGASCRGPAPLVQLLPVPQVLPNRQVPWPAQVLSPSPGMQVLRGKAFHKHFR